MNALSCEGPIAHIPWQARQRLVPSANQKLEDDIPEMLLREMEIPMHLERLFMVISATGARHGISPLLQEPP